MIQVATISGSPLAHEKCPLGRSTLIFLKLPEAFLQFLELSASLCQRCFQALDDVFRCAASKRLVFEAPLLGLDVLGKPFAFLPQARNLSRRIERGVVRNEQFKGT